MTKQRNALRAGIFMIVTLALIISIIVSIRGLGRIIEPNQTRAVLFELSDDIGGLRVGDDVRVGGYKVGVVRDITVVQDAQEQHLRVTFAIPRRLVLRRDAEVGVQGTLTGTSWLNFRTLGSSEPLPQGVALVGKPSNLSLAMDSFAGISQDARLLIADLRKTTLPKVNNAIERTTETAEQFKTTAENASALVQHIRNQVEPIVSKFSYVSDRAGEVLVHVRDLFGESKGDLRGSIANVHEATGTLKQRLPQLMDRVDGVLVSVGGSIDSAQVALEDVKKTMANARDLSASARSLLVSNRGRIESIISSLKTTGDNLRAASFEIRHSPWRLLYKPGKGEVANLNLYDSARQFAEGARQLHDAAAALRDATRDPAVDEARVQKLVEQLDETFSGFRAVERELWKQVRD